MTDEAAAPAEPGEDSHQHADGTTHSHEGGGEPHHHHGEDTHHHEGGDEPHHHHGELAHDHEGGDVSHQHHEDGSLISLDEGEGEHSPAAETAAEPEDASEAGDPADDAEDEAAAESPTDAESVESSGDDEAEGGESEDATEEEAASEEVAEAEAEEVTTTEDEDEADDATEAASESESDEELEEAVESEESTDDETEEQAEPAAEEDYEDAFEVRLVGGLSVLKDSHDPLYVMQAVTNLASTLVIAWTMVALVLGWHEGEAANNGWWVLLAFILGLTVVLVVVLEAFLSHDLVLQQKMENFSRWTQYFMTIWLVGLFIWSSGDGGPDLRGAEPLLEMTVVWLLLFTITEFINRFKLGKMEWKGGRDVMSLISSTVGGVTGLVTGAEVKQMKASSRSVMEGIRWILDFCSLLFFLMIVILTASSAGTTMDDALSHLPLGLDDYGLNVIVKPALWLGSIYLLIFLSETWLRIRPE